MNTLTVIVRVGKRMGRGWNRDKRWASPRIDYRFGLAFHERLWGWRYE